MFYQWRGDDLLLACYIQPKASRNEIAGIHADEVKVRITAPPVDGKANGHLLKFLAKSFAVPRSAVELVSGHSSRHKQVCIHQPAQLPELLNIERC